MALKLRHLLDDFDTALRARNRSDRTRYLYRAHADRLIAWLDEQGLDDGLDAIDRRTLDRYFAELGDEVKDSTAAMHYRSVRAVFGWLVAEDEIDRSPFEKMTEPKVVDSPPKVIHAADLDRLLAACKGREFEPRRDAALILTFYDTGVRLGELLSMTVGGLDQDYRVVRVDGKTGPRAVPLGDQALTAVNRYARARRGHPAADRPELWLGRKGPLTSSGVAQLLKRRGADAGVEGLRPHLFRHSFAHHFLAAGGQETDLQLLAGWSSPDMVRRYGRSTAHDRAIEAHRRFSPGDNRK